jgi:hypothetical protein
MLTPSSFHQPPDAKPIDTVSMVTGKQSVTTKSMHSKKLSLPEGQENTRETSASVTVGVSSKARQLLALLKRELQSEKQQGLELRRKLQQLRTNKG